MNQRFNIVRFALLLGLVGLFAPLAVSQSIYLASSHEVYPFLKRMEARGLLPEFRDAAKPLSRLVLARHLKTLEGALDRMSELERDEYEFLKGEFNYELSLLAGDLEPSEIRWHVISETFPGGLINIEPNLLLGQNNVGTDYVRLRSQGAKLYGYVFDDIGFYFNFVDSREAGTAINFGKVHTPDPGVVPTNFIGKEPGNLLEYNTIEAQLNFHIGQFQFSLEKMQNIWGLERNGNLTLSNKAPSFPQIKMRVPVTDWMDFIYFHADLNSNIVDSSRSYTPNTSSLDSYYREVDRLKYMAAHMIELTPVHGVDISLGESVIYSDRGPLLVYLIPVMFFKSAEHYNNDKDNIQWFANLDLNFIRNVNVYYSLFIDDLSLDKIWIGEEHPNYFGYAVGFQTYDVLLKNVEFNAEYTRINPWVYTHKYPALDYTNSGFVMGSWMGQNADNLALTISYKPIRSLTLGGNIQIYRKGGDRDIYYQYAKPVVDTPFLYGPRHEERSLGFSARYQFVRDGFLDARLTSRKTSDETLNIHGEQKLEFSITARYGLW